MTAVEWLQYKLNNVKPNEFCSIETIKEWFEQAKGMERQQIIDAFDEGENNNVDYFNPENRIKESEQYYNETYKQNL